LAATKAKRERPLIAHTFPLSLQTLTRGREQSSSVETLLRLRPTIGDVDQLQDVLAQPMMLNVVALPMFGVIVQLAVAPLVAGPVPEIV